MLYLNSGLCWCSPKAGKAPIACSQGNKIKKKKNARLINENVKHVSSIIFRHFIQGFACFPDWVGRWHLRQLLIDQSVSCQRQTRIDSLNCNHDWKIINVWFVIAWPPRAPHPLIYVFFPLQSKWMLIRKFQRTHLLVYKIETFEIKVKSHLSPLCVYPNNSASQEILKVFTLLK